MVKTRLILFKYWKYVFEYAYQIGPKFSSIIDNLVFLNPNFCFLKKKNN